MITIKKIGYSIFLCIFFILLLTNDVFANNTTSNKKVVSLVFDDSSSMAGEKAENANYALQALISMLGKDDELNIVRMSNSSQENTLSIQEKDLKQAAIDNVKTWNSNGGTPFTAVDTARNWLINRKEKLNDNVEYWLIIITDGQFNKQVDMKAYMEEINNNFLDLNFNAMLVSIGQQISLSYINVFENLSNCSSQNIDSAEKIIPTMFEISSQINSGVNVQSIDAKKVDSNKISINLNLPINKMNIFIQKNGLQISSIESANNNQIQFDTYDIATNTRTAQMNEILTSKGYIESGKYIITFNDDVDLDATQIKILVRAAVTNDIKLYKRTENKDIELEDIDFFTIEENDEIIAKSQLISLIDGKKIDLNSLKDVDGYYYINNKKIYGKIEEGELITEIPLESGKNTIYSLIEAEGYINEKSNSRVINLMNLEEILIQYNNSKNYEKNGEIVLDEMSGVTEISLKNLPDGVVVEYDEIEYFNEDRILLNENNNTLIIKANKNYRDTSSKIIEITANEDGIFKPTENNKSYFRIAPKTVKYEFVKSNKNQNDINMENGLLNIVIEYVNSEEIQKLDITNVQNIKIDDISNGYRITAKQNKETNEIELKVTPTILSIFRERKISFQIEGELANSLGMAYGEFELGITNFNLLSVLMPVIILIIMIIILCGYLFKNRFNKNGYMIISSESQPYAIKEYTEGMRKYLPFVSDIAQLPNIKIKAKKANKIQVISNFEEIIEVNGDKDISKEINLSINNGELMLNVDGKNIKYEYVALTADEIIEASEENTNNEENWF